MVDSFIANLKLLTNPKKGIFLYLLKHNETSRDLIGADSLSPRRQLPHLARAFIPLVIVGHGLPVFFLFQMKLVTLGCLFALICSVFAIHGNYRQCDLNTGDEIFLDIGPAPQFATEMTFKFGGCLDGLVQYEVEAEFDIEFQSDRDDGGSNVAFRYKSARAIAYTDDAIDALSSNYPIAGKFIFYLFVILNRHLW